MTSSSPQTEPEPDSAALPRELRTGGAELLHGVDIESLRAAAARSGEAAERRTAMLLLLCFVLAQADQLVMGLLALPIQTSLGISNAQLGLLQGFAFSMTFAVSGLVLAGFADNGSRIAVASTCVGLSSVATMACGLAQSFVAIFLLRALTAATEAGLPPAALSIFGQGGDLRRSSSLTNMFMLAPFIGGGIVFILGAGLMTQLSGGDIWRWVFVIVGAPGLVLAPLLRFSGREPERAPSLDGSASPGLVAVLKVVFLDNRFLRVYFAAITFFYMTVAASAAWYPALLTRGHGVSSAAAGGYAGSIFLICGVAGVVAANLRTRFSRSADQRRILRDVFAAAILIVPAIIAAGACSSLVSSLCGYGAFSFCSAWIIATMLVPIQLGLPDRMRGRGTALASLCMSAIGGSSAPLIVGLLVDEAVWPLGQAFWLTGAAAAGAAVVFFRLAGARHVDRGAAIQFNGASELRLPGEN